MEIIDRPELARHLNKVLVVTGIPQQEFIRAAEYQLLKNCNVFDIQFNAAKHNLFRTSKATIDHLWIPIERKITTKYFTGLGLVDIYSRDNGTKSYGIERIDNPVDDLIGRIKAIGFRCYIHYQAAKQRAWNKEFTHSNLESILEDISILVASFETDKDVLCLSAIDRAWIEQAFITFGFMKWLAVESPKKRKKRIPVRKGFAVTR